MLTLAKIPICSGPSEVEVEVNTLYIWLWEQSSYRVYLGTWGVVLEVTYKLESKLKLQVYVMSFLIVCCSLSTFPVIIVIV